MTLPSLLQRSHVPLLTAGLAALSSAFAATPAGTLITNRAVATFTPTESGGPSQSESNLVTTTVQAVCAISVSGLDSLDQRVQAGDQVTFKLTVTNAGNETSDLPLDLRLSGSFQPAVSLYLDSNGNGQVDGNDAKVQSLELQPDASAALLMVVDTPLAAQGEASVNLTTSCGGSAVATVRVLPPPELRVQKSFTPTQVRPGEETTVTVTARNPSNDEARQVVLTDPLAEQIARGLTYVPGSARASGGTLEYSDGVSWSAQPGADVQGLRVVASRLAPGAELGLTFRMVGTEAADGQQYTNVAVVQVPGRDTSASASVEVRYNPAVALGPVGTPQAAEGSAADQQTQPFAVVGQRVCFDHTLQNTGDVADNFRVTVTFPQGEASADLLGEDGEALKQPLRLEPGRSTVVRVCYVPATAGSLKAVITASGERGTSNATEDLISRIEAGLPELKKSVVATTLDVDGKPVTLGPERTVATDDTLTYTLEVRNPYDRPLSDVVVTDPIPAHLDFLDASSGGTPSGTLDEQSVTWQLGTLAPGERRTLTFRVRVTDRAVDGESLKNIFQLVSSEFLSPVSSNEVSTPVWSARLVIDKAVSAQEATYGERLTYTLRIRNTSKTTAVVLPVITDTPAPGLEYIAGTATLNGQPLADPGKEGGSLLWTIENIEAGGESVVTYETRVTPQATAKLSNTVVVEGRGGERAVASNRATAVTKLNPLKFAAISDIVGTVFVDRNRNGLYDKGFDTPIERARIILAGGQQVLTDKLGRYKFGNVPFGTHALRLDPNTTPYLPLHVAQDGGLAGTRTVQVGGLTILDFPLSPLTGEVAEVRRTTLTQGDLQVQKVVYAGRDGEYVVELRLTAQRALSDFQLNDPLPAGAVLKEGRNTLSATLAAGETKLTYRFQWAGEQRAVTTDPVVRWRY